MMRSMFQEPEDAVQLEPEDLSVYILKYLDATITARPDALLIRHNFIIELRNQWEDESLARAYTEAWMWLERAGMLAPDPYTESCVFITKLGRRMLDEADLAAYQRGSLLREVNLDALLTQKALPEYVRGDYEVAIFQAFKAVEVRVRHASNLGNDKIGVQLMREAFHTETGPLTDFSMETSEREAMSHMFAAAIGLMKNPTSHRYTDLDDHRKLQKQFCGQIISSG